ncbi:hypothetical protein [Haliangium sp.]|uniref:hypothetical protein n=1 Tax=Haliangium sp. TaxID=2663208 RepID=UPI003D0B6A62
MSRNLRTLSIIVLAGFLARALAIWITRPEFVGWFNHSYYYWVQVQGLLRDGRLPFEDLPLLFAVYGAGASLLQVFGLEAAPAIVNTTRFVMSLVPALVAVPVYGILKGICRDRALGPRQWVLVAASAFLPLTLVHMPELLQKNCAGVLLLACLLFVAQRFVRSRSKAALLACLAVAALIAVTHVGTLAVTALFAVAMVLASMLERAGRRQTGWGLALVLAGVGGAGLAVYTLDTGAFERALLYARSSLPSSLLGNLLASAPVIDRPMATLGVLVPLAGFAGLVWLYRRKRADLDVPDRVFWLGNTLFAYLLVLPVFDLDVVPRFVLFLPLPALVVLGFVLAHHAKGRLGAVLVGISALGVAALLLGETMNLALREPNKDAVHAELLALKQRHRLGRDDFVLARYGVTPICNWFLGTRAGLITSFRERDLRVHERVFVLNPRQGALGPEPGPGGRAGEFREKRAYWTTRRNVVLPDDAEPFAGTEHVDLYELHALPDNWVLDDAGRWIGYSGE